MELTEIMLEEEEGDMGLADMEPILMHKNQSRNRGRQAAKADMSSFDREKFYKRLGVEDLVDPECLMVAEMQSSEYGSIGLADNENVTLERSIDKSRRTRKPDL